MNHLSGGSRACAGGIYSQRRFLITGMMLALAAPRLVAHDPPPSDIKAKLAKAGNAESFDGAEAVVVLDDATVTVRPNGIATTERCGVVKILKDAAIRAHAVQRFDFDPNTNRMAIASARVHRADGSTLEVDVTNPSIQPSPAGIIFWGERQLVVTLPRLAVGDAFEINTRKTGYNMAYLAGESRSETAPTHSASRSETAPTDSDAEGLTPPMPGHWFDVVEFYGSTPVIEQRYAVRLPKDKALQFEVYNGELRSSSKLDGDHVVYTWERKDFKPLPSEHQRPAASDVGCKLVLATVPDWKEKSRWFFQANEPSFELDDAIKAKVAEITRGLDGDEAKMRALNHWVAENIRYVGSTRGACEGYTNHPVRETFRDRGGVCKDKAGMLVAMLRAAGFESYIVMTQAGSRVEQIPADQFNHAVTCVRNKDGSFTMLDPTWAPKSRELWSSRESEQNIVYGTPEGQDLARTPLSPPEGNSVRVTSEGRMSPDGSLELGVKITLDGYADTALRRRLAGMPADRQPDFFSESLQRLCPQARVADLSFTSPTHFEAPSRVTMTLGAARYALLGEKALMFHLPLAHHPLGELLANDITSCKDVDPKTRKYPLRLRATRSLSYNETLAIPSGWTASSLPEDKTIDNPAASFRFDIDGGNGTLVYTLEFTAKKLVMELAELEDFKSAVTAMDDVTNAWLVYAPHAPKPEAAAGR